MSWSTRSSVRISRRCQERGKSSVWMTTLYDTLKVWGENRYVDDKNWRITAKQTPRFYTSLFLHKKFYLYYKLCSGRIMMKSKLNKCDACSASCRDASPGPAWIRPKRLWLNDGSLSSLFHFSLATCVFSWWGTLPMWRCLSFQALCGIPRSVWVNSYAPHAYITQGVKTIDTHTVRRIIRRLHTASAKVQHLTKKKKSKQFPKGFCSVRAV